MSDVWTSTPKLRAMKARFDEIDAAKAAIAPITRAVRDQIKGMSHELVRAYVVMGERDADSVRDYLRKATESDSADGPIRLFGLRVVERADDAPPVVVVPHG